MPRNGESQNSMEKDLLLLSQGSRSVSLTGEIDTRGFKVRIAQREILYRDG
jgi:hypothetical protein